MVGKHQKERPFSVWVFPLGTSEWRAEVSYFRAKSDLCCAKLLRLGKQVESRRSRPVNKWRGEPFEEEKTTLVPGENLDGLKITEADALWNPCARRAVSEPEPAAPSRL